MCYLKMRTVILAMVLSLTYGMSNHHRNRALFHYFPSLPHKPCQKGVLWNCQQGQIQISQSSINRNAFLFKIQDAMKSRNQEVMLRKSTIQQQKPPIVSTQQDSHSVNATNQTVQLDPSKVSTSSSSNQFTSSASNTSHVQEDPSSNNSLNIKLDKEIEVTTTSATIKLNRTKEKPENKVHNSISLKNINNFSINHNGGGLHSINLTSNKSEETKNEKMNKNENTTTLHQNIFDSIVDILSLKLNESQRVVNYTDVKTENQILLLSNNSHLGLNEIGVNIRKHNATKSSSLSSINAENEETMNQTVKPKNDTISHFELDKIDLDQNNSESSPRYRRTTMSHQTKPKTRTTRLLFQDYSARINTDRKAANQEPKSKSQS